MGLVSEYRNSFWEDENCLHFLSKEINSLTWNNFFKFGKLNKCKDKYKTPEETLVLIQILFKCGEIGKTEQQ